MEETADSGEYALKATWNGNDACAMQQCRKLRDFTLEIRAAQEGSVICSLQGVIATRIFCLLEESKRAGVADREFNCFRTIDLALARERGYFPRREPRTSMSIKEAAERYGYPIRFELWGTYDVPGEIGGYWETCEGIIHEGLILGEHDTGTYIVFDKPGLLPVRIAKWNQVLEGYPETRAIGFFPITDANDTNQ